MQITENCARLGDAVERVTSNDMQDDHASVRHTALHTLVVILPEAAPNARASCLPTLRPLFARTPHDATADPDAAAALAGAFAAPMPLPTALQPLEPRDAAMFLGCYCHLALRGPPPARLQCARAFPALLLAICPDGASAPQRPPLLDTLSRLSADLMARAPCAAGRCSICIARPAWTAAVRVRWPCVYA